MFYIFTHIRRCLKCNSTPLHIVKEIIFEDENDKVKIKFIFKSMSGEAVSGTNDIQNVDCEFIVLVKMK